MKNGKQETSGGTYYYKNDDLHRKNGPAYHDKYGNKEWWLNGKSHREDGPAVEYVGGHREWWIDGAQLTEQEFSQWLDKKTLNEKLEATLPHRPITRRGKI